MEQRIEQKREQLAELCRQHRVLRLTLFGSALREDFDPERSDLDFLVEFERPVDLIGVADITSFTGSFTDTNLGLLSNPNVLLSGGNGTVGTPLLSGDGLFNYDNLLFKPGWDTASRLLRITLYRWPV